jgi:ParB family transcriptional regulator, chromosome partitioning protein
MCMAAILEALMTDIVDGGGALPGSPHAWAARPLRDTGSAGSGRRSPADSRPAISLVELPVHAIGLNPRQPRQVFDEEALDELAASIAEVGLLQPIVVRPLAGDAAAVGSAGPRPSDVGVSDTSSAVIGHAGAGEVLPSTWQLVAGERRLRCVRMLGWDTVPALIRHTPDTVMLRDALVENLQRAQLNPLEEAAAYAQLLEDFGCTQDELARRVGRSRPHLTNTLRLLRLPPGVQRRVAAGVLSQGHARALLSLGDTESMERLATRIVAEGLSVRSVEEIVALGAVQDETDVRRPRRRARESHPDLTEAAQVLSDRLDTRVRVTMGRAKGRVTIEFAGRADLERILQVLGERTH